MPMLLDTSIAVNQVIGEWKDDMVDQASSIEAWINQLVSEEAGKSKKCEVCGSSESLEQHHIAGRKHDSRLITVCHECHEHLSREQASWDHRWMYGNQSEKLREAFFQKGLQDILRLKARKRFDSNLLALADMLTNEISKRLGVD